MQRWARLGLAAGLATVVGFGAARWQAVAGAADQRLRVTEVAFVDRAGLGLQQEGAALLRRHVGQRDGHRAAGDAASARQAGHRIDAVVADEGGEPLQLQLRLHLAPLAGGRGWRASAPLTGGDAEGLAHAVAQGWATLGAMRALEAQGPRGWQATLQAPAVAWRPPAGGKTTPAPPEVALQLRLQAIDWLVAARAQATGDLLLQLFAEGNQEGATPTAQALAFRAMGGLVVLQDRRAVLPFIAASLRKEPTFVLQVVYAVGALGGRRAEGFLVTMAGGHPHPEIRKAARTALLQMHRAEERRQKEEDGAKSGLPV